MPIYEYACDKGHRFELKQSFSAETVATCPTCSKVAKRLMSVPTVVYKGTGFYTTDYARKDIDSVTGEKKSVATSEKKAAAASETKSESTSAKSEKSETKSASKEAASSSKSA